MYLTWRTVDIFRTKSEEFRRSFVKVNCCAYQMSLSSVTIETSAVTSPVLLHLNRCLVIALITHTEDFLILLSFSCIAVSITADITIVTRYWCHRIVLYCNHLYRRCFRPLIVVSRWFVGSWCSSNLYLIGPSVASWTPPVVNIPSAHIA
jgi:hypothetical protein